MPERVIDICRGAEEIYIKTDRFVGTHISFNFYLPLNRERQAEFALLPFMLTSCGKNYPDFSRLNFTLSKLYGANLFSAAEKVGDYLLLKMGISVIDDKFALDNESITAEAVSLLLDLIFNPKAENGAFSAEDLAREKRKAIESIKSEMGEKRIYAKSRLIEEMFDDDIYSTPKCGTISQVENITGESLYKAWGDMLSTAFLRVNVIAAKEPVGITAVIKEKFEKIDRSAITDYSKTTPSRRRNNVKRVVEKQDIAQGKLGLGFNVVTTRGAENEVLTVMASLFGGGPYSKLYANVREKMSLCYYCAARSIRIKGLLTVESGIEKENAEKAEKAILAELKNLQKGDISDTQFNSSILGITDSLKTYNDSSSALEGWYALTIFSDDIFSPEEFAESIKKVTKEAVVEVAEGIKLHTVLKLLPKEEKA